MECKNASASLEAYLDNELDRDAAREIEKHVDTCADCREKLTRLDDLRRSLRDETLHYSAPFSLRQRIRATDIVPVTTRSAPRWMSYAAACLLAFGAGGVSVHLWHSTRGGDERQVTRDLFASHWRALAAASPFDVASSDRHTVKPWFAGKVSQAPVVQDFADRGFSLIGARIDYVGDERVPVLVYRHGQHVIDVFVMPHATSTSVEHAQGYELVPVNLGGQSAVIVSDMDAQEMSKFRDLLTNADAK